MWHSMGPACGVSGGRHFVHPVPAYTFSNTPDGKSYTTRMLRNIGNVSLVLGFLGLWFENDEQRASTSNPAF